MVAVAVALGVGAIGLVAECVGGSADFSHDACVAEAAVPDSSRSRERNGGRAGAPDVDYPTTSVAVQRRRATAQHLDSPDRLEIEIIDGCLAIGQSQRDSVAKNPNSAHAK